MRMMRTPTVKVKYNPNRLKEVYLVLRIFWVEI